MSGTDRANREEAAITTYSPTIKRRRLSDRLRELREAKALTATEAAKRLGWDPSKVARLERYRWKLPSARDVGDMLDLYGVTGEGERQELLTLAKEARQRGWWEAYSDVFTSSLPDFEAGASAIRTYEALLVPGLLQTAAYARAVWLAGRVLEEAAVDRQVQGRIARQQILDRDDPVRLVTLIDEAALLKLVGGPEVMAEQIRHLIAMAARPEITIRVVPNSVGAHAGLNGSFAILDFAEYPSLVYSATATDLLWQERQTDYQRYTLIFDDVSNLALSAEESVRHMGRLVDTEMRHSGSNQSRAALA